MILYYSTRQTNPKPEDHTIFPEALRLGLAPDGGLYVPDQIPKFPPEFWENIAGMSVSELGRVLLRPWFEDDLTDVELETLVDDALNFDAPLVKLDERTYVLELFHGPTLAFKDFAARTMGRLMAKLLRKPGETLHVLTAISGDTGAAVADGFFGVEGIQVWVLYPSGKVSPLQEKQFTTLGGNVTALEVDGTFDDCQRLVKHAFVDKKLRKRMNLTSANSINIGRLLPQMVYYARALAQLQEKGLSNKPVFVVPSGNFGNLTAGILALHMGMPAGRFFAATNKNKTFVDFLESGHYEPRPSTPTISNAMDVGNPSNFERILDLFNKDLGSILSAVLADSVDDDETRVTILQTWKDFGYIADPHTAVGLKAWQRRKSEFFDTTIAIVLATAHPAKFADVMPEEVAQHIPDTPALEKLRKRTKQAIPMAADFEAFRKILLQHA